MSIKATRDTVRIHADKIIDGVAHKECPNCGEMKPLDDFGLRRKKNAGPEGEDVIADQSWCRDCR